MPASSLGVFAQWPIIHELACRLFGHARFDEETWTRLENWLLTQHVADREALARMPRAEVVRLLREATQLPPKAGGADSPPPPVPVKLSPAEQNIIKAIRAIGPNRKRTQKAILDALSAMGEVPSEGTTKITLAAMVRHGILTEGYGLPEWGQ